MHEAAMHEENSFVTLTYAEDHLPPWGSLDPSAFPRFMKRLRKHLGSGRVRYFHCGEYGEELERPHYHGLLFGYDFPDKEPWKVRRGNQVWRSPLLEKLWPYGMSEVGTVTFESAAYVARYITKKVMGDEESVARRYSVRDVAGHEVGRRTQEFATMSRRPGIGAAWLEKFGSEVYPADSVVVRGREAKPPRYYDEWLRRRDPGLLEEVQLVREDRHDWREDQEDRVAARAACEDARMSLYRRGEL